MTKVYHSIKSKYTAFLVLGVLLASLLVGGSGVFLMHKSIIKETTTEMNLNCHMEAEIVNDALDSSEQSVKFMRQYAQRLGVGFEELVSDDDARSAYDEKLEAMYRGIASNTSGNMSYYFRYNPEYFAPDEGFLFSKAHGRATMGGGYIPVEVTDLSQFDPDDEEWMREYVTNQIPLNKKQFFGSPVNMYRQTLTLPADYAPLLFVLKPAFVGAPFDTFKYQDFVRIMDIDPVSGTMKTGQLKCIKFTGQVEEIASSIKDLNLKDVCSCVLIMCGRITISEAEMIHEAIIESSNPEINYLRALTSDSTLPETEVSLVLKFDRDVAATQIANEDVKAYHVNHKNDLQQKQIFFLNN